MGGIDYLIRMICLPLFGILGVEGFATLIVLSVVSITRGVEKTKKIFLIVTISSSIGFMLMDIGFLSLFKSLDIEYGSIIVFILIGLQAIVDIVASLSFVFYKGRNKHTEL